MLHSGSRGPGNRIGTVYIELAKNDMMKLDKRIKVTPHFENLPSNKLIRVKRIRGSRAILILPLTLTTTW